MPRASRECHGIPRAAPRRSRLSGCKGDGQPFAPGWRTEDALASTFAKASLGARRAETQPWGSVGEPRWGWRGDVMGTSCSWGAPQPCGTPRCRSSRLQQPPTPLATRLPGQALACHRLLLGPAGAWGCSDLGVKRVCGSVRARMRGCARAPVRAQLVVLWAKPGILHVPQSRPGAPLLHHGAELSRLRSGDSPPRPCP